MTGTRVVMLVDNGVDGDSRVQKSARHMASLGWDVTLIGRSPTANRRQYPLGDATVLLLPVNSPAAFHWNPRLRSWRQPLAYTDATAADRAARAQQWRRMDLQARLGAGARPLSLLPARVSVKLRGLAHGLRSRQTAKARERHKKGAAPARLHGSRQWRWDEPLLADMDVVMGTEIAAIKPDLIHAHDFRSLPTAVRAADRMASRGKRPAVLYDAHEYLPGIVMARPRSLRGSVQAEAECIGRVDAIVTVSDGIADQLVRSHGLQERPTVVANGPMRWHPASEPASLTVRSEFDIPESTPVFVYLGNASAPRGVATIIDGLERIPEARLVMLTKSNAYLQSLLASAKERGFADRITVRGYVDPDDVSPYISTATASLIPYLSDESQINHNLTIPNKLYEAIQAGTPVVVSDIRSTSEFVREHGVGTTFTALDVDGFVAAAREVIRDEAEIRRRIEASGLQEQYSWETQCAPVDGIYRRITGASPDPRKAALARALTELDRGVAPSGDDLAAASDLALDRYEAASGPKDRAEALAVVERVMFHRTLHFDSDTSPLADDPEAYLARWRATAPLPDVQATLRERPHVPAALSGMRVTVLGYSNLTWAGPVVDAAGAAGADTTVVDLADPEVHGPISDRTLAQIALGQVPERLAATMRSVYEQSDVVWVEWAQRAAVAATCVDPGVTRVIVRLHAYEAFKPALHYVRWGRVDDLVFVGPHFRDMVDAALATSPGYSQVRRHVIPLWFDTDRFDLPKADDARRTLALLKWGNPAKDACWAVQLLGRLQQHDPLYRLLLIGDDVDAEGPAGLVAYGERVREAIAMVPRPAGVELRAHTSDVPRALQEVGSIVSSSVRESFHAALVEGAASRAVPVVRDWPLMRRWDGPSRLFPSDWVVADVAAAAERVLVTTSDVPSWRAAGEAARSETIDRFGLAAGRAAVAALLAEGRA